MIRKYLLIASGKSAKQFYDYPYREKGWKIIAINNVFQYLDVAEYDQLIHAPDMRNKVGHIPGHKTFLLQGPSFMKKWGGANVAGRGIVITSAYYVMDTYKPDMIGFLGCDMNYTPDPDTGNTCIYGIGDDIKIKKQSDPDRILSFMKDPNFFTKTFKLFEETADCEVYNFSNDPKTRLPFLQVDPIDIDRDE